TSPDFVTNRDTVITTISNLCQKTARFILN
ncbi:unnamed protein product, partial [Leptidea sinapis]